jgi:hypothetical protein
MQAWAAYCEPPSAKKASCVEVSATGKTSRQRNRRVMPVPFTHPPAHLKGVGTGTLWKTVVDNGRQEKQANHWVFCTVAGMGGHGCGGECLPRLPTGRARRDGGPASAALPQAAPAVGLRT